MEHHTIAPVGVAQSAHCVLVALIARALGKHINQTLDVAFPAWPERLKQADSPRCAAVCGLDGIDKARNTELFLVFNECLAVLHVELPALRQLAGRAALRLCPLVETETLAKVPGADLTVPGAGKV